MTVSDSSKMDKEETENQVYSPVLDDGIFTQIPEDNNNTIVLHNAALHEAANVEFISEADFHFQDDDKDLQFGTISTPSNGLPVQNENWNGYLDGIISQEVPSLPLRKISWSLSTFNCALYLYI